MPSKDLPKSERDFKPPFCPNPECSYHRRRHDARWPYERRGYRRVDRAPGVIRRFVCKACGRWFSSSTFREDYWCKRPGLSGAVFEMIADGKALRQAARSLGVSATTVKRRQRWLSKQCQLEHEEMMQEFRLRGPVAVDGTRSFAGSQHEPAELNTWVCIETGLHLELDVIPLRRSGRMTPTQRQVRAEREKRLGLPDPRARERVTKRGLRRIARLLPDARPLALVSDQEPAYARAVRSMRADVDVRHRTVSSRRRRDASNPLWRINHLHRFQRHCLANLKRETIAHSKDIAGLLDRALIHRAFANLTKGVSERTAVRSRVTPAMRAGIRDRPVRGRDLFRWRRFPHHFVLSPEGLAVYERRIRARPRERVRADIPLVKY